MKVHFHFNALILKPLILTQLVLTPLILLPAVAHGDDNAAAHAEADHISVIGTRSAQSTPVLPAAIQIIYRDQIARSGADSLVQVLATLGGLQITDMIGNGGRGASVSMRGFGENGVNNVLLLVDGRKLNNPSLAGPDLASISLQNVVRIEILHGSAGSLYGDQASAGVINIITGHPDEQQVTLEAGRGSDDAEIYRASVQQALGNGFSYRLAGEKKLADNYRDNNEQNYHNIFANVGLQTGLTTLALDLQQTRDNLRLPGSLSRDQRDDDRGQSSSPTDYGDRRTDAARLGVEVALNEHWRLLADLSQRDDDTRGALYASPFRYQTTVAALQPRLSGSVATEHGELLLTTGFDQENADAEYDYGYGVTAFDQQTRDLYGQLTVPLAADWLVTAGGRHSQLIADHNLARDVDDTLTVVQLGISQQLTASHRWFLRRDEGFRWPTADENGFVAPTVSQLKPQQSVSLELGLDSQFDALTLTAVAYRLNLSDEIFYDPLADGPFGPGTGANINLDDSTRQGFNVRGNVALASVWALHFNYSYVDARVDSGHFADQRVPLVAQQQAGGGLSWSASDSLTLYVDGQYTGERYRAGDNDNRDNRLGGYTVFNASARLQLARLHVLARVNNLGDKQYDSFSGGVAPFDYYYPAAGRQWAVTVGMSF
ncbi:TonB-dependent receptor [Permianibacter sp. IMCC34836]|uniref:TonB-dependent receptor n=1 Tax=Permianibacter fluminis TaxID=2738515 RepID=UPI001552A862|nr:TonB-dependent receptor [Permianibacter fluminis]NQD38575.1 TonB-dependent receptor [Permianibacter fluminis]